MPHAFAGFDEVADETFYRWIVEQENDWWSREPAEVNAEIKAYVDSLRKPKGEPDPRVDFFISYASADEPVAREIAAILDDLGHSYIVQYRDFAQANWMNAMDDAMERSERLIPIYSRAYVASDHCGVEWNHYYNLDPSSVERRIVGFRIDGADLRPRMQQVNYRDLTRYTRAEREQAIRDWITYEPPPPTRENVGDAVERLLSPKIAANEDDRLDTEPNPEFDVPERESAMESAVRELLLVLDVALDANQNLPSKMQRALNRYDSEVRANGAKSSWGGLDRLINILIGGMSSMSSAEFADGQKETLDELIAAHKHCMDTLKTDPDLIKRAISEISMAGVDAEVVRDLTRKLEQMFKPLQQADRTTARLDEHIEDVIEQGRDVAHEAAAADAETREQGSKRRYLMYVGGIAIAVVSVLSDMTTISASPAAAEALQVGRELVEAFFKAIGL